MNRIRGLALSVGLATLIVAGLACGAEDKQDPTEAGPASAAPQAQDLPGPSGEPALALTHGPPPPPPPPAPSGSPLAVLKFHDVSYVASGGARQRSGEGADFVFYGTEFNVDDLDLVGSTDESNTGYPGATGAGLMIYRLKDGETNDVYQFIRGKGRG